MALLVANMTGAAITLAAGKRTVVVPAHVGTLTYGPAVDVTSELAGLTNTQYTLLEAQRTNGGTNLIYIWSNWVAEFAVGLTAGITVALAVSTNVGAELVQATTITRSGCVYFKTPAVADLVSVVAAVLPSSALHMTIVANKIDVPRKLQVNVVTGSASGSLVLVGIGKDGEAVTDTFDISSGNTGAHKTAHAYASLTSAIMGTIGTAAGTVGIGLGAALALPGNNTPAVTGASYAVHKANVNDVDQTIGTVDSTAGTIEPTTAPDGLHSFQFWYTFQFAHTHTLA